MGYLNQTSNNLHKPHLNQLLHIQIHIRNFTPRIAPQPEESREGDAARPALRVVHGVDTHLFFADDVDDLVFVGGLQGVKALAEGGGVVFVVVVCGWWCGSG